MNVVRKSLKMMDRREKRTGFFLLCLTVLKGLADTAGIASIMPFLAVLGQPELVETNPFAFRVYQALGFTSVDDFLFALGLLVIFVIAVSGLLKVVTVYASFRWIEMREYGLSRKLLQTYLRQPYSFFLSRNTSEMGSAILVETRNVIIGIYRPAIDLFGAATSFVLLCALLLWANPVTTIVTVLTIGGTYFLFFACFKGLITTKGEIILAANKSRFRRMSETFTGIKQIKVSSLENFAFALFSDPSRKLAQARAISSTLSLVPRFGLEVVAFGGIVMLTLILFKQNDGSIEKILPLLGLYAFAGYRLLPVLQIMYSSFIQLRLNIPAMDSVFEDVQSMARLARLPSSKIEPMPLETSIKLQSATYSYPETDSTGLRHIDLEILKGQSLGIVGTTGAGKTTLVDVLLGLLEIQQGSILIDEIRLDPSNVRSWQASIGYVPQDIFLSDASVAENIAMGIDKAHISPEKLERAARAARLYEFVINDLPQGFETTVGERGVRLSGGQRQRLGIARALYSNPQVIIFDEATSALDNTTERELISEISQMSGEQTIIMIAHRLSTIKHCDQIVMLDKGKIVGKGTYEELIEESSDFREMALR